MGQSALKAIADLKVGLEPQHSMDFGITLHDNIPQEGGGVGVGLGGSQPRAVKHDRQTYHERMTLQSDLDDTMHNRENKVTDGQLRKCDPGGLTFGNTVRQLYCITPCEAGSRITELTKRLYLSKTKRGAGIRMERMSEKGRLP